MESRTVIEFGDLKRNEKEKVLEGVREKLIRPIVMEAIELHENIASFLKNVNEDELIGSLKVWGEHQNFDNEFLIGEIPNQNWYYLCNGVLYLNDMVKAIQKVISIFQGYKADIRDYRIFLKVIAFIEEDSDFLYSEIKKEISQKAKFYAV